MTSNLQIEHAVVSGHGVNCRICSHVRGEKIASDADLPWLSTEKYRAIVSIGALVPGWTLVYPTEHQVNLTQQYLEPTFWSFCAEVVAALSHRYGQCVVFEHGPQAEESATSCGTGHAHLHIVPLSFELGVEAIRADASLSWQRVRASDIGATARDKEYLFVADDFRGPRTTGMLATLDTPRSQFFRRVIATRVGLSDLFDYKRFPMIELSVNYSTDLRASVNAAGTR